MSNTKNIIIYILFQLLQKIYCQYTSTRIETALQNWLLSSTQFYRPAGYSIVGYDYDNDKVIIFGGAQGLTNVDSADWYILYIYDIFKDTLTSIPISWDSYGELLNDVTTNAVIINSTMYFTITDFVLSLDLDPIYSYYINKIMDLQRLKS